MLQKQSVKELEVAVSGMGGQLKASTGREQTSYTANVLGKDAGKAVSILSDILLNATLDERAINAEKEVILRELAAVGILIVCTLMYDALLRLLLQLAFARCREASRAQAWFLTTCTPQHSSTGMWPPGRGCLLFKGLRRRLGLSCPSIYKG